MPTDAFCESLAGDLLHGYEVYERDFARITREAKARFEARDPAGAQKDALERLDLYRRSLEKLVPELKARLEREKPGYADWTALRDAYARLIRSRDDLELAETFYNSVVRRLRATVGSDSESEFTRSGVERRPAKLGKPVFKAYFREGETWRLVEEILSDYAFAAQHRDIAGDARRAAVEIDRHLLAAWGIARFDIIEMARPVFYRSNAAFLIGKVRRKDQIIPLAMALLHTERGVALDAVLLGSNEVSIIFSYTHSYFHVEAEVPHRLVGFLKSMLPHKPVAELYTSLGYNRHGKTELYRDLVRHLGASDDLFVPARGEKGMVMIVFTLPSYDVVFKVIRDRFGYTKKTTRQAVMEKYRLVFRHDRAGRLVDAQEFERLEFRKNRFSEDLLRELVEGAPSCVKVVGDHVVIDHLYTERRLTPLNLYLKEAGPEKAREAALDYGSAIKDLAKANIFPGDVLLKNFGVTRQERVVFYDYDELCLLTDCRIRRFEEARHPGEELEPEPWYYVGENDIFPEEFRTFLGLGGELKDAFTAAHSDLFSVEFWDGMQKRLRDGEVADIFPYKEARRLGKA